MGTLKPLKARLFQHRWLSDGTFGLRMTVTEGPKYLLGKTFMVDVSASEVDRLVNEIKRMNRSI